jgi:hypothetical protein
MPTTTKARLEASWCTARRHLTKILDTAHVLLSLTSLFPLSCGGPNGEHPSLNIFLLGIDRKVSKYTTVFAKQRFRKQACFQRKKMRCNRGTVFSTRSLPRCYKQYKLGTAVR